jgi:hypothetical protein
VVVRMTASVQPDLFGDYDAQQADQERRAAERAEWLARFERRWFDAPYDAQGATKKGDAVHGWVCPACGVVDWTDFTLSINHGYDPHWPGFIPYAGRNFGDRCTNSGYGTGGQS